MDPDRAGLRAGHLAALAGALVLVVSLWLPWYHLHLDALTRGQITGGASAVGGAPLAAFMDGLAAVLDGQSVSAWTVFDGADVVLAAGAALVALAVLVAGGAGGPGVRVEPPAAARVAASGGLALGGLVLVKVVSRPGPAEILVPGPGITIGLAGCALMLVGGVLAARPRPMSSAASAPPPPPVTVRPAVDASRSVPPPTASGAGTRA